jgi:hypothetical protein
VPEPPEGDDAHAVSGRDLPVVVGILDHIPGAPAGWVAADHPAALYAFVVGFAVYSALAKAGLRPGVIPEVRTDRDTPFLSASQAS